MPIDYQAHEWKAGEEGRTPVNAENLNRMEQGIADACAFADKYEKSVPNGSVNRWSLDDDFNNEIFGPLESYDLDVAGGELRIIQNRYISGFCMLAGRVSVKSEAYKDIVELGEWINGSVLGNISDMAYACVGKTISGEVGVYPVTLRREGAVLCVDRLFEWIDLTGIIIPRTDG